MKDVITGTLTWTRGVNTDALTTYTSGAYRLVGHGREYGGGVRRSWRLYRGTRLIAEPERFQEGKDVARADYRELLRDTLRAAIGAELVRRDDWHAHIERPASGVNFKVPEFIINELTGGDDPCLVLSSPGYPRPYMITATGHKLLDTLDGMVPGAMKHNREDAK